VVVSTFIGFARERSAAVLRGEFFSIACRRPSLVELIWSYWHEEGNAGSNHERDRQTLSEIVAVRAGDPLTDLAFDPLRPLSNLLWGYVHDDRNRLTVEDRSSEYANAYGTDLDWPQHEGRGAGPTTAQNLSPRSTICSPCTARLLPRGRRHHRQGPTAFPLLNALKDVHLILADGLQKSIERSDMDGPGRDADDAMAYWPGQRCANSLRAAAYMVPL